MYDILCLDRHFSVLNLFFYGHTVNYSFYRTTQMTMAWRQ